MSTAAQRPARYRRVLARGDAFVWDFVWKASETGASADAVPIDLTGASVRFTIRDGATDAVLAALTSGSGGGIELTVGGETGRIRVTVPAATTAAIPVTTGVRGTTAYGLHKYDLAIASPSVSTPETKVLAEFEVWEDQSR